jgi:muconate cycloisomerase
VPSLNITRVESIPVSLPMAKPVVMAGEEVKRADNVLVRIETGDGFLGWGEAASAPTMTGETVSGMVAAVRHLAPALEGRSADDIAGLLAAMHARMYGNHGAKAAIEIALHDLVGRATQRPVHALLGTKARARFPILAVLGTGARDGDLSEAERKKAQGFSAFKIKVGLDGPAADAARTREICALLGGGLLISADANQGFGIKAAVDYVRALDDASLAFLEQPVKADDLAGMAAVAAAAASVAGAIAVGADEGIHCADDIARHHERGAAAGVSLKAIKLGGLRALVAAGELCARLGMRVNVSCKTGESSLACAAALHAAAVLPRLDWALTLTHAGLAEDVTEVPVRIADGCADLMERPGLGIEVDEARLRRFAYAP